MAQSVSSKNTKSEIIAAYEAAQKEISKFKKENKASEIEEKRQVDMISRVSNHVPDDIVKGLTSLKLDVGKSLDQISDRMLNEQKKLAEIQEAIVFEQNNLENKYEIIVNADTLNALMLAQNEQKRQFDEGMSTTRVAFEEEMAVQRKAWGKNKTDYETQLKEETIQRQKERQREEEEYNYKTERDRQQSQDAFQLQMQTLENEINDKRINFEKEFSERENAIKIQEEELNELRSKVALFPEKLMKSIADAKSKLKQELEMEYKYKIDLREKEYEGQLRLLQQTITSLETKVNEYENRIEALNNRTNKLNAQTQEVALKALDRGAQNQFMSVAEKSIKTEKVE